ncbi:MAG: family 43 glycosylhydrolase [Subdoligranulum sp.]|nr:family 43 glycosylhydrolase [Subdoligranulum sp.]
MIYNISMKMAHLLESEQAAAVFDRFLPGMRKMAESNPQAAQLSVEQLLRYARIPKAEELLSGLNAALDALNTPENAISPSEAKLIEAFLALDAQNRAKRSAQEASIREISAQETPAPQAHRQDAIEPGRPWLDTKGERIQAHGGAVIYENGVYYWYGENKEHTDGKNGVWTWGIKVYSSADLCNWTDCGFLIPPVLDDPNHALFPTKRVDRPHLLKCEKTGKYVCWIKLSGPEAAFTIWQADSLLGPYKMVENLYNPGGHKAGDFDLVADAGTGKGYIYFDADHAAMLCMELTDDYLHAEKEIGKSYAGLHPPFTREAPALFAANGKKYMLTSGMTGYVPNRSDSAVSGTWDGVFTSLGDPHVNDASCSSFNSQISKVFRVEGTDQWIAMADRWVPEYPVDARIADLFMRVVASTYEPEHYQATDEERKEMYAANVLETARTEIADYVWLPVEWEDGMPRLRWQERWRPGAAGL